jgi:2,4-diketo-3-deoxy-L-fuconate hydrolase
MKISWFNEMQLGVVEKDHVLDVSSVLAKLPKDTYPKMSGDLLITHLQKILPDIKEATVNAKRFPINSCVFHSPVARPTKIIGTPANYLKHVEEAETDDNKIVFTNRYSGSIREQGLFLKANSALVGSSNGITVHMPDRRTDHEMELGVVIGKKVSKVSVEEAMNAVIGYSIALDIVVRGPEDRSFRKSLDSFAVLGPWLVLTDEIKDPTNLDFSLAVNGELRQSSNTSMMIMSIAEQIAWASEFYTLWPGDILMTGTCEGVGPIRPNDSLCCYIEQIGEMIVQVK